MLVAQITDTHIASSGKLALRRLPPKGGVVDTVSGLERAVAALVCLRPLPDITVVTGDLVDAGGPEEYAYFRGLLGPLRMPVFVIPGNHDAREPMREAFNRDGYLPGEGFLNYVIDEYQLRIVGLDTLVPGEAGGELCSDRLKWIDDTLAAAPDRPTLVLMHHPPFRTGIAPMDHMGLGGGADFAEIIRHHPQVERILLRPCTSCDRMPVCRDDCRHSAEYGAPGDARSPLRRAIDRQAINCTTGAKRLGSSPILRKSATGRSSIKVDQGQLRIG